MNLETFFTVREQTNLFLGAVLLGLPLGLFLDIFRSLRILIPHNKIWTALEDVVFIVSYALTLIIYVGTFCRGDFRIIYIVGSLLGFILYLATIGNIVKLTFVKVHDVLVSICKPIINVIRKFCSNLTYRTRKIFKK